MSVLFEPLTMGKLHMKNRFVRSATYFALADMDGFTGEESVQLIRRLAENDVGLIVTGYAYVLKSGQHFPDMNGIQTDAHIPGYRKMTQAVHEVGGTVVMQIVHCGSASQTVAQTGGDLMAVSALEGMSVHGRAPREMTDEDIEGIIEAFGAAGRRVQEAGFDGVQIHGAHGYLVSQFLSPISNKRTDRWGGSLENRMRFVMEVARAVKKNVDDDFPVMIKLGCRDHVQEGPALTIAEGARVAAALEKEGICMVEISHGTIDAAARKKWLGITTPEKEAYFLPDAAVVREATGLPLALVGGMRSLPVMERVVSSGIADCVSLCRPFIREPGLVRRWNGGDRRPAECITCSGCFNMEDGKVRIFCSQLKERD